MSRVSKILEELNSLMEDGLVDDFSVPPVAEPVADATDVLEKKTRVSRALDVLVKAVEQFKNDTVADIELLGDNTILTYIEGLDEEIKSMQDYLVSSDVAPVESMDLGFELDEEPSDEIVDEEPEIETEDEDEDDEDEEDEEESDFDDEAGLDLFGEEE